MSKPDGEYDDAVVRSIEEFLPYRNEAVQLLTAVAQYSPTTEFTQRIHRLFESLIPYMRRPPDCAAWRDWDFDNFRFVVHELFLYGLAALLKHDRIDQANLLLGRQYYLPEHPDHGESTMVSFAVFHHYMKSLEHRCKRLNLRRLSLRADLLKERCKGTGIDFRHLMQADFVVFMRAAVDHASWWPETLLYAGHSAGPFEIFARCASRAQFDRVRILLAINAPRDLEPLFTRFEDGSQRFPSWESDTFDPGALLGYEHLATRP